MPCENPPPFNLTGGQVQGITQAEKLIVEIQPRPSSPIGLARRRHCFIASPVVRAIQAGHSALLMRSDDSSVDHGVFVLRIICYGFERTSPNPLLRPPGEPSVNVLRGAETQRDIASGNAGGRSADYPIPIAPHVPGTTRQ
jgi:hypothetical protein